MHIIKKLSLFVALAMVMSMFFLPGNIVYAAETGTIYYISSSTGDDSNNGTSQSTPWKTFSKASSVTFQPGDKILLKCGDSWTGTTFYPHGNGTSANPIIISSYGTGDKPILSGSESTNIYGIKIVDFSGYKITNLEFGNIPCGISSWSNNTINNDYLWIENCYFHDSEITNHAYFDSSAGHMWVPYPDMHTGTGITISGIDTIGGRRLMSNVTITGCTFYRTETGVFTGVTGNDTDLSHQYTDALTANEFGELNINNCTFEQNYCGRSIRFSYITGGGADTCNVDQTGYQKGDSNGVSGVEFISSSNLLLSDCEIKNTMVFGTSTNGAGIDVSSGNQNITLNNCNIHDNTGAAFDSYANNSNLIVNGSTLKNNNVSKYTGNKAYWVGGGNTGGIISNCKIYLQNDSQAYDSSIISPMAFDASNSVWNASAQLVYGSDGSSAPVSSRLMAAAGKYDITPIVPTATDWGDTYIATPPGDILDHIYTRVLVLQDTVTNKRLVFVVPEMCLYDELARDPTRIFPTGTLQRFADAAGVDVSQVFVVPTHNHQGPEKVQDEQTIQGIITTIQTTVSNLTPVNMGYIVDRNDLGVNRRPQYGVSPDLAYDNRFIGLKFTRVSDGVPVACTINYPCHNTAYGNEKPENWNKITKEIIGFGIDSIESEYSSLNPGFVALFLNGFYGDAGPNINGSKNSDYNTMKARGQQFGSEVMQYLNNIIPAPVTQPTDSYMTTQTVNTVPGSLYTTDDIDFRGAKIGSDIGFIGVSCEPYTEIGEDIKVKSPFPVTLTCANVSGDCSYAGSYDAYHDGIGGREVTDRTDFNDTIEQTLTTNSLNVLNTLYGGVGDGLVKYAVSGTAKDSNRYNPATNAFDGNTRTKWFGGGSSTEWLQADLGSSKDISKVVMNFGNFDRREAGKDFEIRVSNDPEFGIYTTVARDRNNSTGNIAYRFNTVNARYVKFCCNSGYGGDSRLDPAVYEMEVWGTGTAGTPIPPPASPEPVVPSDAMLSDDFSNGLTNWVNVANATINGNQLCLSNNDSMRSSTGSSWTNYTYEVNATMANNSIGLVFRAEDSKNCYVWRFSYGALSFMKETAGNWQNIKPDIELPMDVVTGISHHFKIEANGTLIKTYIDDVLVDTTDDNTFSRGGVGFWEPGNINNAIFDDIVVRPIPDVGATLSDLQVNGETVSGFAPNKLNYNVVLPAGTSAVPSVTAIVTDTDKATAGVTPAESLYGITTVVVTAQDGTTYTYTIHFTVALLEDDFSNGPGKWVNTTNANISNGQLTLTNNGNMVSSDGSRWTNYTYELDGAITSGYMGLIFREVDENNCYMWQFSCGTLAFVKRVGGSWQSIKDYINLPVPMSPGVMSHIKIEVNGSRIKTYINGTLVDTTDDTAFSSGKVGFREYGTDTAVFDNVSVQPILNTDSRLSDLQVNGVTVRGFSSNTLNYNVVLPESTTTVPTVTATAFDSGNATVVITPAAGLPGTTTIVVTAQDGITTQTYTINFGALFADDFSSGLDNWVSTTNATVNDGQLTLTNNGNMISSAGSGWTNYTYELDGAITSGYIGLIFREVDENNCYMWQFSCGTLAFVKRVGGSWQSIKPWINLPSAVIMTPGIMSHIKIEVNGSQIKTYINGILVDTTDDITFSTGKIGLREYGTDAAIFDNVLVQPVPYMDTRLSDLQVNGTTVSGFSPDTLNYNVELPSGTTVVPTVTATVYDTGKATATVTPSASLPGATTVVVTAQDGTTTKSYTINFTVAAAPVPGALLEDHFSNGLGNWVNTTNATISNGQLTVTNNGNMISSAGSEWTNYTYELDGAITSGYMGLIFREVDENNCYMWQFSCGTLAFVKRVGGNWSIIKDYINLPVPMSPGVMSHIKIEVNGSRIKTYINGTLVDTTDDTTFSAGKVGLREYGTDTAVFDNVLVIPILNTDARLSDLQVNGTTVSGFSPDTLNYNVELPSGTTVVPTVTATVYDTGKATATVTPAASLPGATTVVVTAQDGTTTKTYTINFTVAAAPVSGALLEDDFGNGLGNWVNTSNATVSDGQLTLTNNDIMRSSTGSTWGNYTFEVDAKTVSDCYLGLTFRAVDDNNYYMWQFSRGALGFMKKEGGNWQQVKPYILLPMNLEPDVMHHFKIEVNGSSIKSYIDNVLIDTTVDTTFNTGSVGFRTGSTDTAVFDNVLVLPILDTDARLSDLRLDETTVGGFSPDTLNYNVVLPSGTVIVPTVTVSVYDTGKATAVVTPAASLPGVTTVVITAQDGTTNQTYTINFTVAATPTPTPTPIPIPTPTPIVKVVNSKGNVTVSIVPKLDSSIGTASAEVTLETLTVAFDKAMVYDNGVRTVDIDVSKVEGAKAYETILPASFLSTNDATRKVNVKTDIASITVPSNMLAESNIAGANDVSFTISIADKSKLDTEILSNIGNKPIINLNLKVDGKPVLWSSGSASVSVSIPYTPTADELQSPEHITIWYIDDAGRIIPVPSGRYDTAIGTVNFTITHFSKYAVAFNKKTFTDISNFGWAKNAIEVLASKGVTNGTSETTYSPSAKITRADFLVLLVRTLGLTAKVDGNFSDVRPSDYYYEAIGIAKKLGISTGAGNNLFNPQAAITRQDMLVLAARAMKVAGKLKTTGTISDLNAFSDKGSVAYYAVDSIAAMVKEGLITGSGSCISPSTSTIRAEAAVLMYRIYNK